MDAIYWSYLAALLVYGAASILSLCRFDRAAFFFAVSALAPNGTAVAFLIVDSGHLPLYNLFENLLLVSFLLGTLGLFSPSVSKWAWAASTVLLGVLWFFPKAPSLPRYDYDYPFIVLFHGVRDAALAVVLFSSAHFIQSRLEGMKRPPGARHFHQGRNYLLLGAILFLVSEFIGILWCLNGWGDV